MSSKRSKCHLSPAACQGMPLQADRQWKLRSAGSRALSGQSSEGPWFSAGRQVWRRLQRCWVLAEVKDQLKASVWGSRGPAEAALATTRVGTCSAVAGQGGCDAGHLLLCGTCPALWAVWACFCLWPVEKIHLIAKEASKIVVKMLVSSCRREQEVWGFHSKIFFTVL